MAKIINLKRWHPKTYNFGGEEIVLELKMLTRQEAPEFVSRMTKLGDSWAAAMEQGDATSTVLRLLDDPVLEDAFRSYVRVGPGQDIYWEGEPADATVLYREGSPYFLMEVMSDIQRLAVLSVSEGKAFGSPSGSSSEGTGNSSLDVTSTGNGDGPKSSTVTLSPQNVSSSVSTMA